VSGGRLWQLIIILARRLNHVDEWRTKSQIADGIDWGRAGGIYRPRACNGGGARQPCGAGGRRAVERSRTGKGFGGGLRYSGRSRLWLLPGIDRKRKVTACCQAD